MIKIGVVDGYGGGIGSTIVKRLKEEFGETVEIVALGTNAIATSEMMKAKANVGATGENAIAILAPQMDFIVGSISILFPNSMMGELTPKMAEAITLSKAVKIVIPLLKEKVEIVSLDTKPLPHMIDELIEKLKEYMACAR